MKFSYLLFADAANVGGDGKVNALGIGIRQVQVREFPVALTGVVLGAAETDRSGFGDYLVRLTLIGPDGTRQLLQEGLLTVADRPSIDDRYPLTMSVRFSVTGVIIERPASYKFRLQIGRASRDYAFVVEQVTTVAGLDD